MLQELANFLFKKNGEYESERAAAIEQLSRAKEEKVKGGRRATLYGKFK